MYVCTLRFVTETTEDCPATNRELNNSLFSPFIAYHLNALALELSFHLFEPNLSSLLPILLVL